MYDVIVIGAGPAGLTASIYLGRANKKVLVLDGTSYGGQIITSPMIENYPGLKNISGFDFSTSLYEQATELGAEIEIQKVIKLENLKDKKIVTTEENTYEAKAVIIATGAKARTLGLPNESGLLGKGVSYCAICDGAFFKNKIVAVNGGGNTAFEDALFLSGYCKKVYLIHRRKEFRAEPKQIEQLKSKQNVEFILEETIKELVTDDFLKGLKLENVKTHEETYLEVNGLFISIGRSPDTEFLKNLVELDNGGYIISDEKCTTKLSGVFVAGDCRTKDIRQLTTATSDGTTSALKAISYIEDLD